MTSIIKKEMPAVDGFDGWEDGVEGHDRPAGAGIIQGVLLKFTNAATWMTRDDDEISADLELVAVDVIRVIQKWQDGRPVEGSTNILEPGEKFPDIEAMNAAIPRSEWEEGPTGELRGPWQAQHVLYLVDLQTMDKYTYPTGTTGGRIAIGELKDKLTWIRRIRGPNVYPTVVLSDTFMKTRFGGRQRPHFKIVSWVRLGGGAEVEALPAPSPVPVQQVPAQQAMLVPEPSLSEELNDDLPDDLAPPKPVSAPPAKAKAAPNRRRPSTLEAG
jgi:hypothetical protein